MRDVLESGPTSSSEESVVSLLDLDERESGRRDDPGVARTRVFKALPGEGVNIRRIYES